MYSISDSWHADLRHPGPFEDVQIWTALSTLKFGGVNLSARRRSTGTVGLRARPDVLSVRVVRGLTFLGNDGVVNLSGVMRNQAGWSVLRMEDAASEARPVQCCEVDRDSREGRSTESHQTRRVKAYLQLVSLGGGRRFKR